MFLSIFCHKLVQAGRSGPTVEATMASGRQSKRCQFEVSHKKCCRVLCLNRPLNAVESYVLGCGY